MTRTRTLRMAVMENAPHKDVGGSDYPDFNLAILNRVAQTGPICEGAQSEEEQRDANAMMARAAMKAFKPADEVEAMIAAQAVALHLASMECLRRAMIPAQPSDTASRHRKDAANLARTMTEMVEALDRRRGKGSRQTVVVKHVHVHAGGQAVVGNVTPAGPQALGHEVSRMALEHEAEALPLAIEAGEGEGA